MHMEINMDNAAAGNEYSNTLYVKVILIHIYFTGKFVPNNYIISFYT